jgi:hypothetical protein
VVRTPPFSQALPRVQASHAPAPTYPSSNRGRSNLQSSLAKKLVGLYRGMDTEGVLFKAGAAPPEEMLA